MIDSLLAQFLEQIPEQRLHREAAVEQKQFAQEQANQTTKIESGGIRKNVLLKYSVCKFPWGNGGSQLASQLAIIYQWT